MKTIEQAIKELEADNAQGLSYLGNSSDIDDVEKADSDDFQFNNVPSETITTAANNLESRQPAVPPATSGEGREGEPREDFIAAVAALAAEKIRADAAASAPDQVVPAAPASKQRSVFPTVTPQVAKARPEKKSVESKEAVKEKQRVEAKKVVKSPRTPNVVSSRLTSNKSMRRAPVQIDTREKTPSEQRYQQPGPKQQIPLDALKKKGMITPEEPSSLIAQQFRAIKRPLVRNLANAPLGVNTSVILVTSSSSGEGKSFTAVNLAMSLAMEREKNVLLVDTDSTKASTSTLLGVEDPHVGLMDSLVRDDLSVHQLLRSTNVPNLAILPVGRAHGHATELLASDRMRRTINDLSEGYTDRILVIDSSPLLQTEEAGVLADIAGQIVFVVAAEQTAYATALDAVARLPRTDNVSLVLNKARKATSTPYGYGGYGYGAAVSPDGLRK